MPSVKRQITTTKRSGSRFRFFSDTIAELRKVTWLTKQEITYLTVLVIIVSISVGLVLGLVDLGFSRLVDGVLLGG